MIITNDLRKDAGGGKSGFFWSAGDQPLEGYTIKRGLGIGGFGEVYFATTAAGKEVAIKRIVRNAQIEVRGTKHCLNLRHPNLVQLYDVRQIDEDQAWIVMEYIAGQTLRDLLDANVSGLNTNEAMELFVQLASGVAYLHSQGIVHRDLKPANIFLESGFVKIGDYGLSKFISASKRAGQTDSVGTFHYMAPEISRGNYGKEIDIYALGVILFEMLSGKVPFDGESVQEIIVKHMTAAPDIRQLPEPYASVIAKALAKNPAERHSDVAEMLQELGVKSNSQKHFSGADQTTAQEKSGQQYKPDPRYAAKSPEAARYGYQAAGQSAFKFEEPIAAAVIKAVQDMARWWKNLESSPAQVGVLVGLAFVMVNTANFWSSIAYWTAIFYPSYYFIRYWTASKKFAATRAAYPPPVPGSPEQYRQTEQAIFNASMAVPGSPLNYPTQAYPPTQPLPVAPYAPPVRLPFKKWQAAQRHVLAGRSAWDRLAEWTGSVVAAGLTTTVLAIIGCLIVLATGTLPLETFLPLSVWLASVIWASSAVILLLSKLWEGRTEDWIGFRFTQMTLGLAVGLFAYGMDSYLSVPWNDAYRSLVLHDAEATNSRIVEHIQATQHTFKGFFDAGRPMLPAYLSFFAVLFGAIRWWRLADRVRKHRLSIASTVLAVVLCFFITNFLYFPTHWAAALAGSLAIVLQISSYYTGWNRNQTYIQTFVESPK